VLCVKNITWTAWALACNRLRPSQPNHPTAEIPWPSARAHPERAWSFTTTSRSEKSVRRQEASPVTDEEAASRLTFDLCPSLYDPIRPCSSDEPRGSPAHRAVRCAAPIFDPIQAPMRYDQTPRRRREGEDALVMGRAKQAASRTLFRVQAGGGGSAVGGIHIHIHI